MKNFLIGGTIIDDTAQAWAYEDVTPSQVRAFLSKLEPGEDVTFEISSPGGSVTAGLAIANLIREAAKRGNPCKAHVIGIAASMASVITCACDEVEIDESAFMMIHNPWTVAEGDAEDLRKSADLLDQMKAAIISFYRSKFDRTDDELVKLMDEETWFTGASAADFGFKATVIASAEPLKAAACARQLPGFAKMPENAASLFVMAKEIEKPMAEVTIEPVAEEPTVAEPTEEVAPIEETQKAVEEAAAPEAPVAETVAEAKAEPVKDEFTARLAAAMKSRDTEINDLKAQLIDLQKRSVALLADREKNFKIQLETKDRELTSAKAEVTSLTKDLARAEKELLETASALAAKTDALAQLNAAVNTPKETTERTFAQVMSDPQAKPEDRIEAAKKEAARRRSSKK